MADKSKIRSIRFSEELYELIEKQPGSNFTDKLDILVHHCVFELDEVNKELARVRQDIDRERQYLRVLRDSKETLQQNVRAINTRLLTLLPEVDRAFNAIQGVEVSVNE